MKKLTQAEMAARYQKRREMSRAHDMRPEVKEKNRKYMRKYMARIYAGYRAAKKAGLVK